MYFVNALSRVGLHRQFAKFDTVKFHPNLTLGWEDNDAFLRGGPIFERPQNDSYSVLRQRWYTYGTAWQLTGSSSRISIATLGMHMAIALLHCIVMVRTAQTSEAWDSILDMIALAFNSIPRGNPLENCGTGVMLNETLKQRVRVRAVRNNKDTNRKVELVFSDDTDETLSRGQSPRDPNLKPIEAGRYYG